MQEETNDRLQLVAFDVGSEEYAVPVHLVESIISYGEPTRVPGAGEHVIGVLNLRGKVISVIDLRRRFGLEILEDPTSARILVVQVAGSTVGVLVDSVSEVFALDSETLQEAPPEVGRQNASSIEGIIRLDSRLVIVLNLENLLTEESDADLAGALASA